MADPEAPPHPFKTTMNAYSNLKESGVAQAILISGESGAGKTETTKQCLKMLSECAGAAEGGGSSRVEDRLLSTNPVPATERRSCPPLLTVLCTSRGRRPPSDSSNGARTAEIRVRPQVLETMGNAKTVRNDNSSRFGKFMEIKFDKTFKIAGCDVVDYLLEKSRVTGPGPNERSYHVFYQLCACATGRKGLVAAEHYGYLSQTGCINARSPRGYVSDESRRRRGSFRDVAAAPRPSTWRYSVETGARRRSRRSTTRRSGPRSTTA